MSDVKVSVTFRHMESTEALRKYAEEKIRRIGYGALRLDVPPGEFRELSQGEVMALERAAAGKKVVPKKKVPEFAQLREDDVEADPVRVGQALVNLVDNALTHGDGTVELGAVVRNGVNIASKVLNEGTNTSWPVDATTVCD